MGDPTGHVRHILSLSGGKDSTALAIYLRDRIPNLEYVFCDTGEELPETYEYLERLEAYLGKPIIRINPERPFSHYLNLYRGVLPDARTRWCTRMLKIRPFERYVRDDPVIHYIAIRADESHRKGYISTKPNIIVRYPFIEDGITRADVLRILQESGLGLPAYYSWRSRSGCYFCFFQQRVEWLGLLQHHPELFEKAKQFEKIDPVTGERFTWNVRESLEELAQPERAQQVINAARTRALERKPSGYLIDLLGDDEEKGCLICHL